MAGDVEHFEVVYRARAGGEVHADEVGGRVGGQGQGGARLHSLLLHPHIQPVQPAHHALVHIVGGAVVVTVVAAENVVATLRIRYDADDQTDVVETIPERAATYFPQWFIQQISRCVDHSYPTPELPLHPIETAGNDVAVRPQGCYRTDPCDTIHIGGAPHGQMVVERWIQ